MKFPGRAKKQDAQQSAAQPGPANARRRKLLLVAGITVLLLAVGGGLYFWQARSLYQQSPAYALEQLNLAIQKGDAALLAQVLDSERISRALAVRYTAAAPAIAEQLRRIDPANPPQVDDQPATSVRLYLESLLGKAAKDKVPSETVLAPADTQTLLKSAAFSLVAEDADQAIIAAALTLPGGEVALNLRMERVPDWKIVDIANAAELLQAYVDKLARLGNAAEQKRIINRDIQIKGMQDNLPNLVCKAGVSRIGGSEPVLIISLNADAPPQPETIESFGLSINLAASDGQVLLRPYVEDATHQPEGAPLRRSFTQPIAEELYQRLSAGSPLQCTPTPEFLRLGSLKIYRYREGSLN